MSTTPKVRVGFLSPLLHQTGGTETWHKTLWKFLDRERIEIASLTVLDPEQFHEGTADELRKIAPVTLSENPHYDDLAGLDVLVMWGIAKPQDYLVSIRDDGPKTVFVSHGCAKSRWTCSVVKSAVESGCVDQFVAVSPAALGPILLAEASNAVVIPNGVDIAAIETPGREWSLSHLGRKTLGFVGRMSEEKRPECLIETLAILPEDRWQGMYVGKDYLDGRMAKMATERCPGRIIFANQSPDIANEFRMMDALLVPSATEGFGYQIAEAWAAGVPVLSCPVGIALQHPDCVRALPTLPTALQIRRALEMDEADPEGVVARVERGGRVVREKYTAERFGRAWTEFLCHLARA